MEIKVKAFNKEYPIYIGNKLLDEIDKFVIFPNKTLILTDDNIPQEYVEKILNKTSNSCVCIVKNGERSKSLETYQDVLKVLTENEFNRQDLLISLGGGVIGDLGGFVASTYKRGIHFINVPTTTLSMVDSSIGGKNGVNYLGIKNVIGSFYQPDMVIVDLDTLKSLPKRHYYNGLVEALKSGLIGDEQLYKLFFGNIDDNLEEIIVRSLTVKKKVVEIDPYEVNYRKVLNFGHTFGHALESYFDMNKLYHGEAVGIGMYLVLDGKLKQEVKEILKKLNIDVNVSFNKQDILKLVSQDKKVNDKGITIVLVEKAGEAILKQISFKQLENILDRGE